VSSSGLQQAQPSVRATGGVGSEDSIAAAFQARLAQSSFNRNDTNQDGFVDREEYVTNNMKTREDGYKPELSDVERTWSEIDKNGTGRLSEDEYKQGFSSVFVASVGRLDKPLR
jgi:ribosomal protein S12 methylthiotransferase accessory factor YcaO